MDGDEHLGQPITSRIYCRSSCGLRHLIGIDPDYRVHIGPFLEFGVKGISGTLIDRPNRIEKRPARDRLAIRFEQF